MAVDQSVDRIGPAHHLLDYHLHHHQRSAVSILTTIFVYGWMLTFVADLADLYFHSRNRYVEVSCFRKLFEEPTKESGRSSKGVI